MRKSQLDNALRGLAKAGFVYRHGIDLFLDCPEAKARDAVHVIFAGERVRPEYTSEAPMLAESESLDEIRVLSLAALVEMKLTSYRNKDRTHLRDLLEDGLLDASWPARLPDELGQRLQAILDTPDG